jgi:hypothetical protein
MRFFLFGSRLYSQGMLKSPTGYLLALFAVGLYKDLQIP